MNRKKLFKDLNKLCSDLECNYEINSGGCCYVAACIAEQLEKFNIPFKVVHYDICGCHYAIKVSDRYINRGGYSKKEIYSIENYNSTKLFGIYLEGSWNSTYNIVNNSFVREEIIKIFNENSRI